MYIAARRVSSAALVVGLLTLLAVGCASGDAGPGAGASSASTSTDADPDLVREAESICSEARGRLKALGQEVTLDTTASDPLLESLIRPGTRIYARQAERFRELTDRIEPTDQVRTYVGYFEIIDALLNARLRVGTPNGPVATDAQQLEARFQAMAAEQAEVAVAAGLPGCAIDINNTLFGS